MLEKLFTSVTKYQSVKSPCPLYYRYLEEPTMVTAFNGKQTGKHVVHIACGSTYSAAVTADGELYTWGRGNYGRLGHGMLICLIQSRFGSLSVSSLKKCCHVIGFSRLQ